MKKEEKIELYISNNVRLSTDNLQLGCTLQNCQLYPSLMFDSYPNVQKTKVDEVNNRSRNRRATVELPSVANA